MVADAQISGRVTNTLNEPIPGVAIISTLLFQATTSPAGEYLLSARSRPDWKPRVLIFYAPGFRPFVKELSSSDSNVNASLTPAIDSEWKVSSCTAEQKRRRQGYGPMRFAVPSGVKVVTSHDVDYLLQLV